MIFILIMAAIALVAIALAIYRNRRASFDQGADRFVPPRNRNIAGLFDNQELEQAMPSEADDAAAKRNELIKRARLGDLNSLDDTAGDRDLYSEVLNALIEHASVRQEDFRALVTHIARSNQLRGNTRLAGRVIDEWKAAPTRRSTIEMLHIAALSDDAATYLDAVNMVIKIWQSGGLSRFAPDELRELIESQYWALAIDARASGAGFALKERLAEIRRELATTTAAS